MAKIDMDALQRGADERAMEALTMGVDPAPRKSLRAQRREDWLWRLLTVGVIVILFLIVAAVIIYASHPFVFNPEPLTWPDPAVQPHRERPLLA